MSIIEVTNLYKIFGTNKEKAFKLIDQGKTKQEILEKTGCTVAVNNANFSINRKETFVIMGLSGSGKSTLLRCVNRLIPATKGEILVDGQDVNTMNKAQLQEVRRNKMSMVFQHFGLLPHRNVINNVEFGLEINQMDKDERKEKAQKAIELVGLNGYELSQPNELSGGMQQRVGLARALANDPEILLMDEAFSALDPLIRCQMQDELIDLQDQMHKTIVFITHDLDEALKLGDRIVILGPDGVIRQTGTPEEIISEPADDFVREFVQNVDRTKVITASTLMKKTDTVTIPKDGSATATKKMEKNGNSYIYVLDNDRRLQGIVTIEDTVKLQREKIKELDSVIKTDIYTAKPDTNLSYLLTKAFETKYPIAIINSNNKFLGVVYRSKLIAEVNLEREQEEKPVILTDLLNNDNSNITLIHKQA